MGFRAADVVFCGSEFWVVSLGFSKPLRNFSLESRIQVVIF